MSPNKMRKSASNSNDRKTSDLLPDIEDLGKVLSSSQAKKSNQGQTPDGRNCSTCNRNDTCKMAVQASSEVTEQASPISGEVTVHTKDRKFNATTAKSHNQAPKQEPKTTGVKAAQQANKGMSTKAAEKTA